MFGGALAFVAALLAVFTLVASSASHELLHIDERAPAAAASAAKLATLMVGAKAEAPAKSPKRHGSPVHECSGHCAGHTAAEAPLFAEVAMPAEHQAAWMRPGEAMFTGFGATGPERPPRA